MRRESKVVVFMGGGGGGSQSSEWGVLQILCDKLLSSGLGIFIFLLIKFVHFHDTIIQKCT